VRCAKMDAGRAESKGDGRVVTFVTGNKNKLTEVQRMLSVSGSAVAMRAEKIDLPELQGEPTDIAREKCVLAAQRLGRPVIVEDTCLCFNALGGLPGPYVKWFLDKIGLDGLVNMLAAYTDKSAYAQCIFAYCDGAALQRADRAADAADRVQLFVGRTPGTIVPPRGEYRFGWDPVFQPDGFELTYAEMDRGLKDSISHRSRAFNLLCKFFDSDA